MAKQIARKKAGARKKTAKGAALVQRSTRKVAAKPKAKAIKRAKSAAAPTLGAASAIAQKLVPVGPKDPAGRIFRRYWIPIWARANHPSCRRSMCSCATTASSASPRAITAAIGCRSPRTWSTRCTRRFRIAFRR